MATGSITFENHVRVPADALEFAGFRRWMQSDEFPTRGKISFLDGEVDVDMSPENLWTHNKVKGECHLVLGGLVNTHEIGHVFCDGALVINEIANLSTEPDLTFCSFDTIRSGRVVFREWTESSERFMEIAGSPDMVLEVVSNTSVRKDTVLLPEQYYRAGIEEFWRIDVRSGLEFIIFIRGDEEFEAVKPDENGWLFSPVFQRRFRLEQGEDPLGNMTFTLLMEN